MKKVRDLESTDFPNVNEVRFPEWKEAFLKYTKWSNILGVILLLAILQLALFREQLLSNVIFGIILLVSIIYTIPALSKVRKLQKRAGISTSDLKQARKGN